MKIRVYTDTSAIGGCFNDEFTKSSMELVDHFKTGEKILVISDLTLREIEDSHQKVQDVFQSIPINFRE